MRKYTPLALAALVLIAVFTVAGWDGRVIFGSLWVGMKDSVGLTIDDAGAVDTDGAILSAGTVTGTRLISTVATGTAPLTVASITEVANLRAANSSQLLSGTWAIPGTIGSVTPNTVAGTTGSFTGGLTVTRAASGSSQYGIGETTTYTGTGTVAAYGIRGVAKTSNAAHTGSLSGITGVAQTAAGATNSTGTGFFGLLDLTSAGTFTNGRCASLAVFGATGVITNLYGLYVSDMTAGATLNYAIYSGLGTVSWGGDEEVRGGDTTNGVGGSVRGTLLLQEGAGGNTPGYLKMDSANGTSIYVSSAADGSIHSGPTVPTADATNLFQTIDPAAPPTFSYLFNSGTYYSGTDDSVHGNVAVYGGDDYGEGGTIKIHNNALEDDVINFIQLEADAGLVVLADGTDRLFHVEKTFVSPEEIPLALEVVNWSTDTTPSVAAGNVFRIGATNWTAGNDITALDGMPTVSSGESMEITIIGGDSDCNIIDALKLRLNGNWRAVPGSTLKLIYLYDTDYWYEISRSANG